jgi:FtsP/CotA-like multicopper oxidase with cupredoxin domain
VTFLDENHLAPFPNEPPAQKADATHKLMLAHVRDAWTWTLNASDPFGSPLELGTPLLWDPNAIKDRNLIIETHNGTWVDIILTITPGQPSHPIHKHSNKAYIIGSGTGPFPWATVEEAMKDIPGSFNLENPLPRDGFYTPPAFVVPTWMAIRYQVVNPGAFLLHCHINPHLTGGMALAILDGVEVWPEVPREYGPK